MSVERSCRLACHKHSTSNSSPNLTWLWVLCCSGCDWTSVRLSCVRSRIQCPCSSTSNGNFEIASLCFPLNHLAAERLFGSNRPDCWLGKFWAVGWVPTFWGILWEARHLGFRCTAGGFPDFHFAFLFIIYCFVNPFSASARISFVSSTTFSLLQRHSGISISPSFLFFAIKLQFILKFLELGAHWSQKIQSEVCFLLVYIFAFFRYFFVVFLPKVFSFFLRFLWVCFLQFAFFFKPSEQFMTWSV